MIKKEFKLAVARMADVVIDHNLAAYNELCRCGDDYYHRYHNYTPSEISGCDPARDLFSEIGIDPTKRRPSSEALLRRALNRKGFFSINNLVDTGNWCSLEFLLPVCVYDGKNVKGRINARLGRQDEGYIAIDGNYLNLTDRLLICDDEGAIGSPIKDSLRTRVTETTQEAVLLIYAPGFFADQVLSEYLNTFCQRTSQFCGGNISSQDIIYVSIT